MPDGALERVAASVERDRTDDSRRCPTDGAPTAVVASGSDRSDLITVRAVCTECGEPWSPTAISCPACQSTNVTSTGGGWWSCMSCGHRWQLG